MAKIDITERRAVAQNAAVKILTAMQGMFPTNDEAANWIRCIEDIKDSNGIFLIRCTFWIKNDPLELFKVDIQLISHPGRKSIPWLGLVHWPHSDRVDRWDFDQKGKLLLFKVVD